MSRVRLTEHGVWCYVCQEVHNDTGQCEHGLEKKDGIERSMDGYITDPADMGHFSPHMFHEIDGFEQCMECGATKIPANLVETDKRSNTDNEQ